MARHVTLGTEASDQFPVLEADGYTKKSGETAFVKKLWKNGDPQALPVTITEIGTSGEYEINFTPDTIGFWSLEVLIDYNKQLWYGEYDVAEAPDIDEIADAVWDEASDEHVDDDTMGELQNLIPNVICGRAKIIPGE